MAELDPDPLGRGTDPGIRILTKMSRIRITAKLKMAWYYQMLLFNDTLFEQSKK